MNISKPTKISRLNPWLLKVEWPDGYTAVITLEKLRRNCPCADCNKEHGESSKPSFSFPVLNQFKQGMNELKELHPVGNYAINPIWGDGHNSGIYTWQNLRDICEMNALSKEEIEQLEAKSNKMPHNLN
jgi:DUF971 family protein